MSDFIDYLRKHGLEIGRKAENGDKAALNIIAWYRIWASAPGDFCAKTVLEEAVNDYRNEQEAANPQ